jgi:TetR/AcrR family transcriptional regulator
MNKTSSGSSGTRLPAAKRRETTVQAVLDLAAVQNPAEITTTAIAEQMHITQGALFRHFATKDAIWQAVIEWVTQRLLARVAEAARTAKSPLEALETIFMAHIESHVRHAGVPRIIFGELQRAEDTHAKRIVRKFMGQYVEKLQAFIEQGKVAGEIDREVDAKAAATMFVGMIQGLVVQSLVSGNLANTRTKAREVFVLYLRAVRRAP